VAETQLRQKSGVVVVAIERRGGNVVSPGPGETLAVGDEIFLFGDQEQLKLAEEFLGQNGVTAI
jgi:K+/H+ antiporter YhaU regulatory subunit KhtT